VYVLETARHPRRRTENSPCPERVSNKRLRELFPHVSVIVILLLAFNEDLLTIVTGCSEKTTDMKVTREHGECGPTVELKKKRMNLNVVLKNSPTPYGIDTMALRVLQKQRAPMIRILRLSTEDILILYDVSSHQ
jgi:hypothetical protein